MSESPPGLVQRLVPKYIKRSPVTGRDTIPPRFFTAPRACGLTQVAKRTQRVINIHTEQLITISEAPAHLPPRHNGRRIHLSACYRWIKLGIQGIVLEAVRIGGVTYTSLEALQRFAERSSTDRHAAHSPTTATQRRGRDEMLARKVAIALGINLPEHRP